MQSCKRDQASYNSRHAYLHHLGPPDRHMKALSILLARKAFLECRIETRVALHFDAGLFPGCVLLIRGLFFTVQVSTGILTPLGVPAASGRRYKICGRVIKLNRFTCCLLTNWAAGSHRLRLTNERRFAHNERPLSAQFSQSFGPPAQTCLFGAIARRFCGPFSRLWAHDLACFSLTLGLVSVILKSLRGVVPAVLIIPGPVRG